MKSSIRSTFLTIQTIVALLVLFLAAQAFLVWRVCSQGTQAIQGLEHEGIPSLTHLAGFKENLNLYRLYSYEVIFAQEKDRPAKLTQVDAVNRQNIELLRKLQALFPNGEGQQLIAAVQSNLTHYTSTMTRLQSQLEADFQAAMQMLDQDIPARVDQLNASVQKLAQHCEQLSDTRVRTTSESFASIRVTALGFGLASIAFSAVVLGFVTMSSGRIRQRLAGLVSRLGDTSTQLNVSGESVASASQSLARGSSEQAASLEETGASLEEMSSMTRRNAENAQQASELAKSTRQAADRGANDMQDMAAAMNAIKASSDDIAKIIKAIDDIAFQTNILALNAAVEAARAGEAGLGFAVVADEVRNLAQRSAQAAKDTATKIEAAIANSSQGVTINGKVGETLADIVGKARKVDELVAEIATASKEQSQGITQVNSAVSEMDKVTQHNAANAEESAAAAADLNAQAAEMKHCITDLLELVGGSAPDARVAIARSAATPAVSAAVATRTPAGPRLRPTTLRRPELAATNSTDGEHFR